MRARRPAPDRSSQTPSVRGVHVRFLIGAGFLLLTIDALAAWVFVSPLWGASHYAFFPPWVGLLSMALFLMLLIAGGRILDRLHPPARARNLLANPWLQAAVVSVIGFALFWSFRIRHLLLGDGLVLAQNISMPQAFHPLEPVGIFFQQNWYAFASHWFRAPGTAERDVAWRTIAMGSALCGVLFALIAAWIVRNLFAATTEQASNQSFIPTAALLLLLSQGFIQLFFGYVETYPLLLVAMAYYVGCVVSYLQGRGTLLAVLLSCLAALSVHLSAAALLPSLLFVVIVAIRRRPNHSPWGELLAGFVAAVLLLTVLSTVGHGFDLSKTLLATVGRIATGESDAPGFATSRIHALDILNEQILIGPLGLFLLILGLVGRRAARGPEAFRWFMWALVIPYVVVVAVAGDSNLGYARNWDLLAPVGFVFTVAGLYFLLEQAREPRTRRLALGLAVAVSLFHTVPWIALNATEARGVARFATLPLGGGRTESTLGCWEFRQGRYAEAEEWLNRSLRANAANPRAYYWIGRVFVATGRIDQAASAFERARQLRPDVASFRLAWINTLVRLHLLDAALQEATYLVTTQPSQPRRWGLMGLVLLESGRPRDAVEAFQRARILDPDERSYERLVGTAEGAKAPVMTSTADLDALTGL